MPPKTAYKAPWTPRLSNSTPATNNARQTTYNGEMPNDWRSIDRSQWRDDFYKHFLRISTTEYEALNALADARLKEKDLLDKTFQSIEMRKKRDQILAQLMIPDAPWVTGAGYHCQLPADWEELRHQCLKTLISRRTGNERRRLKHHARKSQVGDPVAETPQALGRPPMYPTNSVNSVNSMNPIKYNVTTFRSPTPDFADQSSSHGPPVKRYGASIFGTAAPEQEQISTETSEEDEVMDSAEPMKESPANTSPEEDVPKPHEPHNSSQTTGPQRPQRNRLSRAIIVVDNSAVKGNGSSWFSVAEVIAETKARPLHSATLDSLVFERFCEEIAARGFEYGKNRLCWKAPHGRLLDIEDEPQVKHAISASIDSPSADFPYIDFVVLPNLSGASG